jgi:hypothetical protein
MFFRDLGVQGKYHAGEILDTIPIVDFSAFCVLSNKIQGKETALKQAGQLL